MKDVKFYQTRLRTIGLMQILWGLRLDFLRLFRIRWIAELFKDSVSGHFLAGVPCSPQTILNCVPIFASLL